MIVSDLTQELDESNLTFEQYRDLVMVARNREGEMFAITSVDIEEAGDIRGVDRVVLGISSLRELGLNQPSSP